MNKIIVKITHLCSEVVYTCPHCKKTIEESFDEFVDEQELPWGYFADWTDEDIFCPECGEKIKNVYFEFE